MTTGGVTVSNSSVFAGVLTGGRGERFWPISTHAQPKAFLRLVGSESLLQATVRRVRLLRIREAWGVQEVLTREYSTFQEQSVDYGVLERMDGRVAMVRAEFAWDDPGAWDALAWVVPVDDSSNVIVGEVESLDTTQSVLSRPDCG